MSSYNESKHFESIVGAGITMDSIIHRCMVQGRTVTYTLRAVCAAGIYVDEATIEAAFVRGAYTVQRERCVHDPRTPYHVPAHYA